MSCLCYVLGAAPFHTGVYTADPRIVPDYQKVECMSYEEAMEVSNFGGQVCNYAQLRF